MTNEGVPAQEAVDDRRLAHARGAEQTVGFGGNQGQAQFVVSGTGHAAERDDPGRGQVGHGREAQLQFLRGQQIRFGHEDDRFHAAVRGHDQIAFQTVRVEVEMGGLDDEGGVDVGRDQLLLRAVARGSAPQQGLARHDLMNDGRRVAVVILDNHPVSDAGQVRRSFGQMGEPSAKLRRHLARLAANEPRASVHGADAGRSAAFLHSRCVSRETFVETKIVQGHERDLRVCLAGHYTDSRRSSRSGTTVKQKSATGLAHGAVRG